MVDKFLSANKPDIAFGVPSLNDLLQFESDMRWNKCCDYILEKHVSPKISPVQTSSSEMSWLSKPLGNNSDLHNPDLNSGHNVISKFDHINPISSHTLSHTKNLISGIIVSTLTSEHNKLILASILGAFIVKLNKCTIAPDSKTDSSKPWSGFNVSYLDLVVANARSVMNNIIVYINTDSESVPLSEQDISEQEAEAKVSQDISEVAENKSEVTQDIPATLENRYQEMVDNHMELDFKPYFKNLTLSQMRKMYPFISVHVDKSPFCAEKPGNIRDEHVDRWTSVRNLIQKTTVEHKSLYDLLSGRVIKVTESQKGEIIERRAYLEFMVEDAIEVKDELYSLLSSDQKSWVNSVENTINPDGNELDL